MIDPAIPDDVVATLLVPRGVQAATAAVPGNSGAKIFRCHTEYPTQVPSQVPAQVPGGDQDDGGVATYALKCWPSAVDLQRISEIHQVMRLALRNGCPLVPALDGPRRANGPCYFQDSERRCWDIVAWLPGQPIGSSARLELIQAGAAAITQFHHSVRPMIQRRQVAPAVLQRLHRLSELDRLIPQVFQRFDSARPTGLQFGSPNQPLTESVYRAGQLMRLRWDQKRQPLADSLRRCAETDLATQVVLRDVHRQHVLFAAGRPTGLIDYDAVRVDTPLADLTRWAGSFWHPDRSRSAIWDAVLAGARSESPSKDPYDPSETAVAQAILAANPWINLANWLVWIVLENRSFPAGVLAVADRVSFLTDVASREE